MSIYKGQEKVLNNITPIEEEKVKEAVKANMEYKDTRNVDSPPAYYFENFPTQNVYEFKTCGALGITSDNYGALQTLICWKDSTAPIYQVLVCDGGVYYRSSTISTDMASCTWRSWNKLAVTP